MNHIIKRERKSGDQLHMQMGFWCGISWQCHTQTGFTHDPMSGAIQVEDVVRQRLLQCLGVAGTIICFKR